ncbi:MAG: DegT/DnrJ/EryC1/StrS family aminotransferase [Terriglobales bacterium]
MGVTQVPFVDLVAPHLEMEEELLAITRQVLRGAAFIGGPMVEGFERDFAAFCGVGHAVAVNSGTDALRFALLAAGVGAGEAVITVANTFIATAEAISQAGARPLFVDVDPRTFTLDPECLREFLRRECVLDRHLRQTTHRQSRLPVTAMVPVHLFGQCADMDAIQDIAEEYNLAVIEDACQAHGAEYFSSREGCWRKAGAMGRLAAFSFYPGKNLGACGEGGAVTTDDEELARRVRLLRDHGSAKKYHHEIEGYNGRLDALQAGYLQAKLRRLPGWNEARRQHAARYTELLRPLAPAVAPPHVPAGSRPVFHLYVVRVDDRDRLQAALTAAGIGTGLHYPVPLHLQKAYAGLGYQPGDLPRTEQAAKSILSLPMFPHLTNEQLARTVAAVAACVGGEPSSVRLPAAEQPAVAAAQAARA